MKTVLVCTRCGSADVLTDAFVHANDCDDVRTFDDQYCVRCEGECHTTAVEVPDDFDIHDDFFDLEKLKCEQ